MKKTKFLLAFILGFVLSQTAYANDEKNPCGALLCILGGQTSGECAKYYKYYTIGLPKECAKECKYSSGCTSACIPAKQIAHLKNCKMEKASNVKIDESLARKADGFIGDMDNKINQFSQIRGDCTKAELQRVESKVLRVEKQCDAEGNYCKNVKIMGYRINPMPTQTCQILANNEYSLLKISYTCPTKFYEEDDWKNGYEKQEVTKSEWDALPNNQKAYEQQVLNATTIKPIIKTIYYNKVFINKDCWKVEQKEFK